MSSHSSYHLKQYLTNNLKIVEMIALWWPNIATEEVVISNPTIPSILSRFKTQKIVEMGLERKKVLKD